MSKGRAAGWALAIASLFWPRFFILMLWIFGSQLGRAFDGWVVPVLGFFVLPWTTVTYASMWSISSDRVAGVEWVFVAIALVLDLWTYAGIRRLRT
jgi:hypothetical protein